jgi:TorA maturation chaperone TorD
MFDAAERKMLYGLLSVLFRHPDEETLGIARDLDRAVLDPVFPGLPQFPPVTLEELERSYHEIFADRPGGAPAPPYGSVYLDKPGSAGASTRLVATIYASAGLDPGASPEPPDYLPTELEFLYYLSEGEQQSRAEDTGTPPHRWLASQADFFHNFFAPWIAPFCDRIAAAPTAHPFHRWAAELLRRFTELERQRLKV